MQYLKGNEPAKARGAREPISMKGGRRAAGELLRHKRLCSAGGAVTTRLLEQRPHLASGCADHASARQAEVSRYHAERDAREAASKTAGLAACDDEVASTP